MLETSLEIYFEPYFKTCFLTYQSVLLVSCAGNWTEDWKTRAKHQHGGEDRRGDARDGQKSMKSSGQRVVLQEEGYGPCLLLQNKKK